jgi:ABC-type transporter Mla subunit MlaD
MPSLPDLVAAAARTAVDTTRAVVALPQTLVELNRSMVRLTDTLDAINAAARETLSTVGEAAARMEKFADDATPLLTGLRQTQGTVSALAGAAGLFARRPRPAPERPVINGRIVDADADVVDLDAPGPEEDPDASTG